MNIVKRIKKIVDAGYPHPCILGKSGDNKKSKKKLFQGHRNMLNLKGKAKQKGNYNDNE